MREDNANSDVAKPETELDAFGCVNNVVNDLTGGGYEPTTITEEQVMDKIRAIGLGNLAPEDWKKPC